MRMSKPTELPEEVEQTARAVIAAGSEVHRTLGPGYAEPVYQKALAIELGLRGLPFLKEEPVSVSYKGQPVGEGRMDFLVADSIVVELKAVDELAPVHMDQVLSYLKATSLRLGLLINFNTPLLRDGIKRIIC